MLAALGVESLEALVDEAVPEGIRLRDALSLPAARGETEALAALRALMSENRPLRSFLGMGYHDCITPPVILRNLLEDPGWYTAYTPYQAEIAQGRLEMLLNFQTLICGLTGLEVANASLLDEATAAAEGLAMCLRVLRRPARGAVFLVAADCHPQTVAVVRTRAEVLGAEVRVQDPGRMDPGADTAALLIQYPGTDGRIRDHGGLCDRAHEAGALVVMAADPLALVLLRPPGEIGADVAVGSTQRFGLPMGYGGPHAAYLATRQRMVRQMPGRLIGLSRAAGGGSALRMALQTREQHIRRHGATSNICTAQVLLAVVAAAYALYHGREGLDRIARRIHRLASGLREGLRGLGHEVLAGPIFDTLRVEPGGVEASRVLERARALGMNLRDLGEGAIGISLDETTAPPDLERILEAFGAEGPSAETLLDRTGAELPAPHARATSPLPHPVFERARSETEMLRYLQRLKSRDLSLVHAMIPLGSCTMKLNATSEMIPVTWPEVGGLHPFAPADQAEGYRRLFGDLERWLCAITGFAAFSLQPNAGAQGEYTGLLAIRAYHRDRGEPGRDVCLIPTSAHGTNPASAVMAGLRVVPVACDEKGNISVEDLRARAAEHAGRLAALMVTYPSTHGVFEASIREICAGVHEHGGQVYMDGANMNAMVGLVRPVDLGADVCHLNLHKTFAIPHGGGGPGMGPIGVRAHLAPFLPGHPVVATGGPKALGTVSAAPWGSPSILPISWMYIAMMGPEGLREASAVAIAAANYVAGRLEEHYPVLYRGRSGRVAHECILDLRPLKQSAGITVDDVAKRLMDYGFHAPTMSWPVPGTLMIEPTESEPLAELDRFCDAMIAIREEIAAVERGEMDRHDNPLKNAPHTAEHCLAADWRHPYDREAAAFPAPWTRAQKYWPPVGRVDNAFGDRNLRCTAPGASPGGEGGAG